MSNTEAVAVTVNGESHELRALPVPSPSSPVTLSRNSMHNSALGSEFEHDRRLENEQQLAPVDGGIAAWRLLGAAFVFETLLWGKAIRLHQAIKTDMAQGFHCPSVFFRTTTLESQLSLATLTSVSSVQ